MSLLPILAEGDLLQLRLNIATNCKEYMYTADTVDVAIAQFVKNLGIKNISHEVGTEGYKLDIMNGIESVVNSIIDSVLIFLQRLFDGFIALVTTFVGQQRMLLMRAKINAAKLEQLFRLKSNIASSTNLSNKIITYSDYFSKIGFIMKLAQAVTNENVHHLVYTKDLFSNSYITTATYIEDTYTKLLGVSPSDRVAVGLLVIDGSQSNNASTKLNDTISELAFIPPFKVPFPPSNESFTIAQSGWDSTKYAAIYKLLEAHVIGLVKDLNKFNSVIKNIKADVSKHVKSTQLTDREAMNAMNQAKVWGWVVNSVIQAITFYLRVFDLIGDNLIADLQAA